MSSIDNNNTYFWAPNQHIRIISEGSCDSQDKGNSCLKSSFAITGIYYILRFVKNNKTVNLNCNNTCLTINKYRQNILLILIRQFFGILNWVQNIMGLQYTQRLPRYLTIDQNVFKSNMIMPTVSAVARVFGVVARCLLVQVKRAHLQVHNDTLAPDMAWVRFKAVFFVCVHMCVCVCGKYSKWNTLLKRHKLMSIAKK